MIRKETKEKTLTKGEIINVKIKSMREENGKLRLDLEQTN